MTSKLLPDDILVFERGWLSSNNILLLGPEQTALVDSGYGTHAVQTLSLLEVALDGRPLDHLVNTHLHSDHCGGNAALQRRYPELVTHIPPGEANAIASWDESVLSYPPTGQYCPRFAYDQLLIPGNNIRLGMRDWEIHAAPGHDPDSVMLFQRELSVLISADALWANGFGVVFPEIVGQAAFHEVAQTLDLIDRLQPRLVIPGHGAVLNEVGSALSNARRRLDQFVNDPVQHARYAAKVLLKFKLLELQEITLVALNTWAHETAYIGLLHRAQFSDIKFQDWIDGLLRDLVRSGAAEFLTTAGQSSVVNR